MSELGGRGAFGGAECTIQFLRRLVDLAEFHPIVPTEFHLPRDPKDEPYVNLAIAAGARYVVSRDKDLLELMDPSHQVGRTFRAQFPSLKVMDPASFLREVRPG